MGWFTRGRGRVLGKDPLSQMLGLTPAMVFYLLLIVACSLLGERGAACLLRAPPIAH